jgi:sugar lactone lactonase YvrE
MHAVDNVAAVQCEAGESPRWDSDAHLLYWADIVNPHLYCFDPATGDLKTFDCEVPVTGIGLRQSGGLVLASKTGLYLLDSEFRHFRFIADPEAAKPNVRFNDGMVDRCGRYWAGTLNETDLNAPDGSLYRLDPDCTLHTMDTGLQWPNGIGWSPDDRVMYLADSGAQAVYAYDFDYESGTPHNRRVFAEIPKGDGVPDGLTVDCEGGVWLGHWGGWHLKRYYPDGMLDQVVQIPVQNVTSCMFGGQKFDELYVTTAWYLLDSQQRSDQPCSGDLFRVKQAIRGLPEPKFMG